MKSAAKASGTTSADEKDWQAECDLKSLIEAEKIKADPARLKAALAKKKDLQKALKGVDD